MSRVQLALNVDDLDAAVAFYMSLLNTEPAKRRPGYANFAVTDPPLKLVLIENPEQSCGLNHLGIERRRQARSTQRPTALPPPASTLTSRTTSPAATRNRTSTG